MSNKKIEKITFEQIKKITLKDTDYNKILQDAGIQRL